MKKSGTNEKSAGSGLKSVLCFVGFVLIFVLGLVFGIFDMKNFNIKNFGKNEIYQVFVYVFLIVALFIPCKLFHITKNLKKVTKELKKTRESYGNNKGNMKVDYEEKLSSCGITSSIWSDYKATFINSTKSEYSHLKDRTRANADLYFNAEEIVSNTGNKLPSIDLFKIISGTFVGLGILGTFIGFSQSLANGIDVQNQEQMDVIVAGLKVAFNTSIFGLFSSIIYNFLIANPLVQLLNDRCKFLSDELDSVYYISDEECMRTLGHIVFETKESITSSTSDMAKKVADAILEGREAFTAELNKTTDTLKEVSSELGKTPESIKKMNEELNDSIETAKKNNQEMLDSAIDSIKNNIEKLFNNFSSRFDTASQTMADSMESVKDLPNQFDNMLSNSSDRFKTNLEDVMNNTKTQFSQLISESETSIKSSLEKSSEENISNTKTMLDDTKSEFDKVAENMQTSFKECAESATHEFKEIVSETKKQLVECQDGFAEAVAESVEKINAISEKLSSLANDYSNMEESLGNVSNSIKEAETDLSESVKSVFEEAPGKMRSLVDDLSEAAISVNSVMDSVAEMKQLPEKISEISKDLVKTINQLDTTYNATMDKIIDLSNKAESVEKSNVEGFETYAERLDSVTKSMENREGEYINLGTMINENFTNLFSKISELVQMIDEKKENN